MRRAGWVCGLWLGWGCVEQPDAAPPAEEEVRLRFAFPVADPEQIDGLVGVDHDPDVQTTRAEQLICRDYLGRGFPHCYDEHDGSDFLLKGGFEAMDAGSVAVIAAASGVVEQTRDGQYDRCHGTLDGVDCDGYDIIPNLVAVRHPDGVLTRYLHLAKDSVVVEVGQEVAEGEVLGLVGSSGNSSLPHLHFEVQDAAEVVYDPYAAEAEASWWCDQGPPDGLPGGCELR